MIVDQNITQRQSLSLHMTQQMQQAIKLLQLSNLDLSSYLQQQALENPLIELTDSNPMENETLPEGWEGQDRVDLENIWGSCDYREGQTAKPASPLNQNEGSSQGGVEYMATPPLTLAEHLRKELDAHCNSPSDRLVGFAIIEQIDECGYFRGDVADIAHRLKTTTTHVESILHNVQKLDPAGVGARNLAECFYLQLADNNQLTPQWERFLSYLSLLETGDITRLCQRCNLSTQQVQEYLAVLRRLHPKPGLQYAWDPSQTVVPDVFVITGKNPYEWLIKLNYHTLPKVLINQNYMSLVKANGDRDAHKYLQDHLQSANFLVRALDQRAQTMLNVTNEIVAQQKDFFAHGVHYLRPMSLNDIAQRLGVHESTVSRVTSNKYMATPLGLFDFKYFFTSGLKQVSKEQLISARSVSHRIQQLIQAEDLMHPLSDDHLVKLLHEEGVTVARRTVAKYREALNIASSFQRKRLNKMTAALRN